MRRPSVQCKPIKLERGLRQGSGPIRVAHIIPEDGLGGVETAAREMALRDALRCEFHTVLLTKANLAKPRPNIHATAYSSPLHPLASASALRTLLRLDPDVVICSLWKSIPLAILAKLVRPRIKLVAFYHSAERVHGIDHWMHELLLWVSDAIWADSEATIAGHDFTRWKLPTRAISYIIDRPISGEMPVRSSRFVSWSRLHPHKGIDRSIDLIARLVTRGVDASFDLWGPDQGIEQKLREQAQMLGVSDRVRFHGSFERTQLSQIASGASFLLQLSRQEGMAMVVVEAMQLGLVPVVTRVGEVANYCREGENALFVDPESLDEAADNIASLIADGPAYARMSEAARDRWANAPLYPDEVCAAARDLVSDAR